MPAKAIIFRSFDAVAVDLAETHLRAAEIPFVRVGRGNAAMLGVGDSIVEQLLEVDDDYAEQAREILESVAVGDSADRSDDESAEQHASPTVATTKTRFIGASLSILWPGLGVAYAGFTLTGAAIGLWSFAALFASFKDPVGFAFFGGLLPRVVDLVATQLWLKRFGRRGLPVIPQAMLGIMLVVAFIMGTRHLSIYLWRMLPQASEEAQ